MTNECPEIHAACLQPFVVEVAPSRLLECLLPFAVDLEHFMLSSVAQRIVEVGEEKGDTQNDIKVQLNKMREIIIERFLSFETDEALVRNFNVLFPAFPIVSRTPLAYVSPSLYTLVHDSHVAKTFVPSLEEWDFGPETSSLVKRLLAFKKVRHQPTMVSVEASFSSSSSSATEVAASDVSETPASAKRKFYEACP